MGLLTLSYSGTLLVYPDSHLKAENTRASGFNIGQLLLVRENRRGNNNYDYR